MVPDANGGHCLKPFQYLVPCKLRLSSSFAVDTTKIADGQHKVQVVVHDTTEEGRAVSAPFTISVDNGAAAKPKIILKIAPRETRNKHTIHWTGRVIGGSLPRHGVTVLAQARQGHGWIVFRQIAVDAKGRFKFDYRFHATTVATTYEFRVALAHARRYSFGHDNSNVVEVHVKP
jgi:hypothetical protein